MSSAHRASLWLVTIFAPTGEDRHKSGGLLASGKPPVRLRQDVHSRPHPSLSLVTRIVAISQKLAIIRQFRQTNFLTCIFPPKGGIAAITRSMAVEFAPQKVRVNAIAPAATMTDRVRGRFEAGNPRVTKIVAGHLLGLIEPEDIANMAVFLASDELRMVTGHVYPVDSGITIS